jgi:hypothetical protein
MLPLKWCLIRYYKETASYNNIFIGNITIIKPIKYELQKNIYYTIDTLIYFITD